MTALTHALPVLARPPEVDRAIEQFSLAYADQNESDYGDFKKAEADQRIAVERGV